MKQHTETDSHWQTAILPPLAVVPSSQMPAVCVIWTPQHRWENAKMDAVDNQVVVVILKTNIRTHTTQVGQEDVVLLLLPMLNAVAD